MTTPTGPSNEEKIARLERDLVRVVEHVKALKDRVHVLEQQVSEEPLGLIQAFYPIWVARAIEHVKDRLSASAKLMIENQDMLFKIDTLRDAFADMTVERLRDYLKALYKGEDGNIEDEVPGIPKMILEVLGPGNEDEDEDDG